MIGIWILAVTIPLLIIGVSVVVWEWTIRSDPDAPIGGKIVAIALFGVIMGGVVSCGETVKTVQEIKNKK